MRGSLDADRKFSVTSVLPDGDVPVYDDGLTDDDRVLVSLGYKAEFKREFGLWSTFSVSFAVLGLLPSFAATMYYNLGYAGTPAMTWGWLLASTCVSCVALSMAELCSSMPTSGGLYYAAAVLAPEGWGPLAAWITGWSNWIVQITGAPSVDYALAAMILAAVSMEKPDFVPTDWQVFLLTTLIMLIHGCISSMPTAWVAKFNGVGTTMNLAGLAIVIILIPAGTSNQPKFVPSKQAWGEFTNGTDFPIGVAFLMSFVGVIWTMSGYDAPFHLSEECSNANVAAPRAIALTAAIGGFGGWFLNLVVAYTVTDIDAILNSDLGQPWAAYLLQVLPRRSAMAALAITIITAFFMGQGCMVAASRVTFAYARDGCFPGSRIWSKVNKTTRTPVNAVWLNTTIGILLTLLIFGGPVTIGAIFSVGAIAAFVAFTIPIFIRVFFVGNRFRPGPWNLGRWSMPIGTIACAFVALMLPILCLPTVTGSDLTAELMNWTCVVYGVPMLFAILYYFIDAHKWFKGPKVNVQHKMMGRPGNVIDGEDGKGSGSSSNSLPRDDKKIML